MNREDQDNLQSTHHNPSSYFEQLGGEPVVRKVVDDFLDRVFADRMIGFFFRNADKKRIKDMEFQLAANFLGAPIEYSGRPLGVAHARHPIMGGHFARRRQILSETLEGHNVPENIREAWLRHTDNLRPQITPESGSDCDPVGARRRVQGR